MKIKIALFLSILMISMVPSISVAAGINYTANGGQAGTIGTTTTGTTAPTVNRGGTTAGLAPGSTATTPLGNSGSTYTPNLPFKDVPGSAWYYSDVKIAYETGLINGIDENTFGPDRNMTYAQAIKLAACMHQKYTTGSVTLQNGTPAWYDSYVAYAKDYNIINKNYEWDAPATRAEYAEIFAKALPDEALNEKNNVVDNAIPDVTMSHPQAAAIYKLYRAGVLVGNGDNGIFYPNNHIIRSEVAAILTRMMDENARKDITLGTAITRDRPPAPNRPTENTVFEEIWNRLIEEQTQKMLNP